MARDTAKKRKVLLAFFKIQVTKIMKSILFAFIFSFINAPSFARDGEVFFRNKGRVEVGPGSRLELIDCVGSHDSEVNANVGVACSIKVINYHKTPCRTEVQ